MTGANRLEDVQRATGRAPAKGPARAPLSYGQRALWYLHQLASSAPHAPDGDMDVAALNAAQVVRICAAVTPEAGPIALAMLTERHPILRATYHLDERGEPYQVINPQAPIDFSYTDAEHWTEAELDAALAREAGRPFDLESGPVMRLCAFRRGPEELVAVFAFHHIAIDLWSIGLLTYELGAFYNAAVAGEPVALRGETRDYASFAQDQIAYAESEKGATDLAYWAEKLGGPLPPLDLPLDHPRPPAQMYNGAAETLRLDAELTSAIRALAESLGASLYDACLAAYQGLLGRYTAQEDILVGALKAGRSVRYALTAGYFVNPVVMRADLGADPSFARFVQTTHQEVAAANAHESYPFPLLVEKLAAARDPARPPIFQALFSWQKTTRLLDRKQAASIILSEKDSRAEWAGLPMEIVPQPRRATHFELTLLIAEAGDGLVATVEYNTALFEADTARRFLSHFEQLLRSAAAQPDLPLSRLSILADGERAALLSLWAGEQASHPPGLIHTRFEAQARLSPGSVALQHETEQGEIATLTYRDLDRRAEAVAARLRDLSAGPETLVGLVAGRGPQMIVAILGILKAGAAYLPLDPAYPPERLAYMVDDSRASFLLIADDARHAASGLLAAAEDASPCGREQGIDLWRLRAWANGAPGRTVRPDHLAYVIYTSGSTGKPKGVGVTHGNVTRLFDATEPWFRFGPDDAWSLFHSYAFDFSVWEIWGALLYGGRLCITPYLTSRSPEDFYTFLRRHAITVLNQTPSAFRQLAAAEERLGADPHLALRLVIFGGEALNFADLRGWFARHGDERPQLVNMYGITETTVHVTYRPLRAADLDASPASAIGRPIPDLRLFCLDRNGELAPFGVPGELFVGGAGVARGYLGRPDLTAERFVPIEDYKSKIENSSVQPSLQSSIFNLPSMPTFGWRMYRTGDLGRILPNGDVLYLGRADQQVKIRGFRIEPGEVDAVLRRVPGVRELVVIPQTVDGDTRLVAYVARTDDTAEDELRVALLALARRDLPDYMVPTAIVFLPALPLTAQGKLDRAALPSPEWAQSGEARAYVEPEGELERELARILRVVLRVDRVGRDDNFFALGGHSLLAIQTVAQIRQTLRRDVSLRDLFEAPTVRELARRIQDRPEEGPENVALPATRAGEDAPLSYAQQRLWFFEQLDPGTPLYNIPVALRVRGQLDASALRRVLNAAVARHSALRATFRAERGVPRQVIAPALALELPVEEVGGEFAQRVEAEARRAFDLERGPLLRAALLRIAPRDHILTLTAHHLVADGWSLGLLAREIVAGLNAGDELRPPPLPVEYGDYAAAQRAWLEGEQADPGSPLQRDVAYWRKHLAGLPPRLNLPTDRPRPLATTYHGAVMPFALDAQETAALRRLAQQQGLTLYMVLLAAFQALLARYSGQTDISVGTAVAGRDRAEWQALIGLFVNTLVMRADLSPEQTVAALLARTRETALAAFSHARAPFDLLVDALGVERSLGHHPLFSVMLSLQEDPLDALSLPGADLEWLPVDTGAAKYDFLINLLDGRAGLRGVLEYNTDLYDASTMRRFLSHFATLLRGLPAYLDRPVGLLPVLAPDERRQILQDWNDTTTSYPRDLSLAGLFAVQAAETPDALAVEFGEDRLTYRELDAAANRLAALLQRRGAAPDRLIAVLMERSADMIVALLAIIKSGAAYLPLDPANPPERLAFMLGDAAAPLALTDKKHARVLEAAAEAAGAAPLALILDAEGKTGPGQWTLTAGDSGEAPICAARPDNLAYVIYTSGSTGAPKGIAIPQRAVTRLVRNTDYIGLTPDDRIAQASNASFDAATFEIWGALLSGAALIGVPRDALLSPAGFAATLRRDRINTLFLTTALFNQMAAEAPDAFSGIKHLMFGGEACDPRAVEAVLRAGPPDRLLHVYGPTESTTYASWHLVTRVPPNARTLPIGRPIANTRIYVLDAMLQPVPPGVVGELFIAGDGLARSYLRRPDLTAERFLPDPFSEDFRLNIEDDAHGATGLQPSIFNHPSTPTKGWRMYRTGDLVRYLPDGSIEFVGRADGQVKLRGFRVELGEIESALAAHSGVRQAAVLLTGEGSARRLVAFVAFEAGPVPSFELAAHLRRRLPDYMTPSVFVEIAALPLGATGKVDRAALEQLAGASPDALAPVAPRSWHAPAEELIAAIWQDVLGRRDFGPEDSFFEVGGHSLLAVQVVSRIEETFGVSLPVADVFDAPTVAGLAARVDALLASDARAPLPPIRPRPAGESAPLSYAQQRLWFLQQLEPGASSYNVALALRLRGELDEAAFAGALSAIVARHEALRTRFEWRGESPRQVVDPHVTIHLLRLDLRAAAEPEREAQARAAAEANAPFDLSAGPLLRALLLRVADDTRVAVFTAHHIVCDGWSLGVFVREFAALYAEAAGGPRAELRAPALQYADYAAWQQRWLTGDALEPLLRYWRDALTPPPPPLDLPADRPRPDRQSFRGAHVDFALPSGLIERLRALARAERATLFMVLLAGYETLLYRMTGQTDFAVGAPVAGRSRRETEDLIGVFINPLALRADFGGAAVAPAFDEIIRRVRKTALAAYAHADAPFERVVDALQPPRELGRTPLFQVLFALQTSAEAAPLTPLVLPAVTAEVSEVDTGATKYDLSLTALEVEDALSCRLGYNADIFDAATAERIAERFAVLLSAAVESPSTPVDHLAILPPEEAALISAWEQGPSLPFDARPFPARFAEQVARSPEAVAVEAGHGDGLLRLTYAELDAAAEQVADALRSAGAWANEAVGVLAASGPPALTAILGIWKAGAAYLPLDPTLPPERLRFMVADARVRIILADSAHAGPLGAIIPAKPGRASAALLLASRLDGERAPAPASSAESLAYVIYTSGSTGAPKGVAVEHGSLAAYLDWVNAHLLPQPAPALPAITRLSFDASLKQLFAPLLRGDAVWFPPEGAAADPAALLAALASRPEVALNCVPSLWNTLLSAAELGVAPLPRGLTRLFLGGESVPPALLARTRALLRGVEIWNLYGPTEATANACAGQLRPGEPLTIGRPIANASVRIVNAQGQPAGIGIPGELLIGGAGVARGYLDRPDLTAERFVPDPFIEDCKSKVEHSPVQPGLQSSVSDLPSTPTRGWRMYRTGDRCRWLPDGRIEFLGRLDDQVKLRGFRVEPGEIEAVLALHPAVREVTVMLAGSGDSPRLVAVVVPREPDPDAARLAAALSDHARAHLPEYMVPAHLAIAESLPRLPSGKLDRRAVALLAETDDRAETADASPPEGPVEELVAAVWQELLGLTRAGRDTDFFRAGGHSLLAAQAVSRLRAAFGVDLPLAEFFRHPTVRGVSDALAARLALGGARPLPPIPARSLDGPLPLSFGQERLWFLDQLEPRSYAYNVPVAVRLEGALDVPALRDALNAVVDRHAVLRSTFAARSGAPALRIAPELHLALPVEPLTCELTEAVTAEARQPFDLARGPLLRARLWQLADDVHVLMITAHHAVSDGWSLGVLVREVAEGYANRVAGADRARAPLAVQYPDFAAWQREWLSGEAHGPSPLAEQLAFWQEQLAGLPPRLELPLDHPRPPVKGSRGATITVTWPAAMAEAAAQLARREGATLFMALLAGFQALLARYSGQDDIPVATAVAGRSRPEVENLIGFFVNTVVVRGDLSGAPTFVELLARVRAAALAAFAHADAPFEAVVDALAPERDTSQSPVFQVMFLLQNAPLAIPPLPGLRVEPMDFDPGIENFDLTLAVRETGDALSLSVSYDTALFEAATIRRLLDGYAALMAAALAAPKTPVWRLPVLSAADFASETFGWNQTEADYPAGACLHELFEAQAAATPDAVALCGGGIDLTYAQLNALANALALQLRAAGVGPESIVALLAHRSLEAVTAMLATLKAGGAWLPVDPALPAARIAYMLRDCGAAAALVQSHLSDDEGSAARAALAQTPGIPVLPLPSVTLFGAPPPDNPPALATPANLAYLIYTSGSTGAPRGVCVEHRSAVNHSVECARRLALAPGDRYLQFASLSFDTAIEEIFPALISGATVVLRPNAPISAGHELRRLIEEERLTVLDPPTAFWHEWAYELSRGERLPDSVRLVFVGGEKIAPDRLTLWREHTPRTVRWLNGYGPTEATVIATIWEASGVLPDPQRNVPIGRPIANARVYLLDSGLQPVPPGAAGEICIGGVGVARGYFGQPDATAERFVPDPFAQPDGSGALPSRLFRTGDRGRRLPNGDIEFLGRVDHQVKVRGFRVELEEIERALALQPSVRDAAVVYADGRLVAFVVAAAGLRSPAALRQALAASLPAYMVPQRFITLDSLPLTPIGKIDRRALAALAAERAGDATAPAVGDAPASPAEQLIAQMWGDLLGVERVGRQDNFFDLGGHSLLATRAISRLRAVFGVELPLLALFDAPTPAGLARAVDAALAEGAQSPLPPVAPLDGRDETREEVAPLSFGQERLWFLDRLHEGAAGLNLPVALRITGPLDLPALTAAFDDVVARHDALRVTFRDGLPPAQVIAPPATFRAPVAVGDLPGSLDAAVAEEAARPFDLERGPLIRVRLLSVAPDERVLLLTLHHSIADGWSIALLARDLTEAYARRLNGDPPEPLDPRGLHYADFARWQRTALVAAGADGLSPLDRQLAYWTQQLAGLPPLLELPADRPRPVGRLMRGATLPFTLPAELTARLRALARSEGATLYMVLLAAYQLLLARHSGQDDIAVGAAVAGRNRVELEPVVGFFANSLVLRGDLRGNPSFRDLLARTRRAALEAFAHADAPFEKVVEALNPQRDLDHAPLFQAAFALENAGAGPVLAPLESAGLRIEPLHADTGIATYDLFLSVSEDAAGLSGFLKYSADLFDRPRMERFLGHLATLLDAAAADADTGVRDLPMLTAPERALLAGWTRGKKSAAEDLLPIHERVAAFAARSPDAIALAHGDATLTYAALDARATEIAALLRGHGAHRGDLVALYLDRSFDMVAAILGAFKTGAAYLPLDPTYPAERIAYMLADSGARLILTHRALAPQLPSNGAGARTLLVLDATPTQTAAPARASEKPGRSATLDDVAYVIYTSGSSGLPKGAALTHRGLSNLAAAQASAFALTPDDRVLQFSRLSFDASIWEIVMALNAGATLCLAEPDTLASPHALAALLRHSAITVATLPPVMLAALPAGDYPELRAVIAAGERCPAEVARRWLRDDRAFWNAYGPTETTVCATWHRLALDDAAEPPIGRPLPNLVVRVLDKHLQPVPTGVPGELFVGGPALALGYVNRPDLTADRFIPDPFIADNSSKIEDVPVQPNLQSSIFNLPSTPTFGCAPIYGWRMYRTGDRVRWREDGALIFVDRLDEQVKIRGFRVELGEIEARLAAHEQVAEAAVVAVPALNGHATSALALVAYVRADELVAPASFADDLRGFLGRALPDYMVPAAFCFLDAFPLTPSGKIDRRALVARGWPHFAADDAPAGEFSPAEAALAGIWARVLSLPAVRPTDNFFALGGDSILAMEVTTRAREAGLSFPVRRIFETRNLAELAASAQVAPDARAPRPADPAESGAPFPLTPIQQWFLELDLPEPDHWNQSALLEVSQLRVECLQLALNALLERHDALRLRLERNADGGWSQRVVPLAAESLLTVVDLSDAPADERASEMRRHGEALQRRLSLAGGRLFAAAYFHAADEPRAHLFIVAHHWAVDAVSWRVLLEDLRDAYIQAVATGVVQFGPGTTTFREWVAHLSVYARSPQVLAEAAYWQATDRANALLPAPLPPSEGLSIQDTLDRGEARAETLRARLPAGATRDLVRGAALTFGADARDALVTALAQAWQHVTGERELRVALEGHGRREELFAGVDLTRTVGWFTTLYPLRICLQAPDESPLAALAAVKEQLRATLHGGLSYGLLRYGLAGDPEAANALAAAAQPVISFNYLGQVQAEAGHAPEGPAFRVLDERLGASRSPQGLRPFAIEVTAQAQDGEMVVEWTGSVDAEARRLTEALATAHLAALEEIARACSAAAAGAQIHYTPSDFPDAGLSQSEVDALIDELEDTPGQRVHDAPAGDGLDGVG